MSLLSPRTRLYRLRGPALRAVGWGATAAAVALAGWWLPPTADGEPGREVLGLSAIPPRRSGALTGTQFGNRTLGLSGSMLQAAAEREIRAGNVPDFVRELRVVHLGSGDVGDARTARVWVIPDYVAIGSNADFLTMPLALDSARRIAVAFDCLLPTPKIVDAVWAQADRQLTPAPMPPGPRMRSMAYYLRHREIVQRQRGKLPRGALVAGHKKDVVLTDRLRLRPGRIAIYGWHRRDGEPIQPVSTAHGARYADYSHGLRLVWQQARVGDRSVSLYDALASPVLAPLFSYDGSIVAARELMQPWEARSDVAAAGR